MTDLIYKDEVYAIIGAAMEVHDILGPGFFEGVYQESLVIELGLRQIPFEDRPSLTVTYKGYPLNKEYIPDLICYGKIIVELKALDRLTSLEEAQLLNYLKVTGFKVGLLINFGAKSKLEWRRFVN